MKRQRCGPSWPSTARYEILFFCDYLVRFQRAALETHMPLALRQPAAIAEGNTSVSLWLRRI